MLSKILSKETCAGCKFCCSFRRCSLWETPLFPEETVKRLGGRFNIEKRDGYSYGKMDFSESYTTDNPEEEAACQYLNPQSGCTLSYEDKPFDCKIWPLRIMRKKNSDEHRAGGGEECRIGGGEECRAGGERRADVECRTCGERRSDGKLVVALTPTCPAINKVDIEEVRKLVADGLGNVIYEYAKEHPYIIKEYRDNFPILMEFEDF